MARLGANAGRGCDATIPPAPWGGPWLPIVRTHLQGGRQPAQFSFLFTERLLTLVSQILFFPPPSPGRRPSGGAHPSPPPHAHHRAMARQQTRAPFFKVVRLHLINSQPPPDWLREKEVAPPSLFLRYKVSCVQFAHVRPITGAAALRNPKGQNTREPRLPARSQDQNYLWQDKGKQIAGKTETMKRQCERDEVSAGISNLEP